MFSLNDVADYYNSTQIHYEKWWGLKESKSLHYGIWDRTTRTFQEALENTNRVMETAAEIEHGQTILDAGCGVGGAAFYLADKFQVQIEGISLSSKQIASAQKFSGQLHLQGITKFQEMDYCRTSFDDQTFDVIWACESLTSCKDLTAFVQEASRLLKPGGRLVLMDYFEKSPLSQKQSDTIKKWLDNWAIDSLLNKNTLADLLNENGFNQTNFKDYTPQIYKSSKRMYWAGILGALPSEFYNLFNRGVRHFAKNHFKSGIYQYKALNQQAWSYELLVSRKND
jgi:cyclopropane fatty-acyl-phospholipid synthase-like methyltransferase